MDKSLGEKFRKAAGSIAGRTEEVVRAAGGKLGEFQVALRLDARIQELQQEREQTRNAMADLLIRMFDQNTFAEALLKPDYLRIREIDEEIVKLTAQRATVRDEPGAAECRPPEPPAAEETPPAQQAE